MPNSSRKKKLLVFLSYASEDKPTIRELCRRLKDEGFDPWLDEDRILPGQDWQLEIEGALRRSDAILVSFSEKSLAKEGFIQREYKTALDYQKEKPEGTIFVIPVRLDNCEIPGFLRDLQCVDYPSGYERLVMSLKVRAGKPKLAPRPLESRSTRIVATKGNSFKEDFRQVQLVLQGDFEGFNETRQEDLVSVLASMLRVDSESIRILQVYAGSIVVVTEMRRIAADRLSELARNGDFRLIAEGIRSIQIESEQPIVLSGRIEDGSEPDTNSPLPLILMIAALVIVFSIAGLAFQMIAEQSGSDNTLSTLITVLGGILTAIISAYVPYLMYSIEKRKFAIAEQRFAREQEEVNGKGGKRQNPGKPLPLKPAIDWPKTVLIGIAAAGILFLGRLIYVSASAPPPVTPAASLAAATIEFRITSNHLQIIVPAGGTLDTLPPGEQVNIETRVTDANGIPYPDPLTITYYFSTGTNLITNLAPYIVKSSDTISVKIEDPSTGEVVIQIMRVSAN